MALDKGPGGAFSLRTLAALLPYSWLAVFLLVPFLLVLKISLSDSTISVPPYSPLLDISRGIDGLKAFLAGLDLENYALLFDDSLYWRSYVTSLWIAGLSTAILLLIGYPMALAMARAPAPLRSVLVMLVILPFWTSFLIRVYAWIGILNREGLLNTALLAVGIIDEPLNLLGTNTAVLIGIVYSYLPFMVLPLYASLEKIDPALDEAAADLGSTPWNTFWRVTLPLSLPGAVAGSMLVFIPAVGEFVIPDLLGGSDTLMIGRTLWTEFFSNRDWPLASAVAVVLLALLVVPIVIYQNEQVKFLESQR